MDQHYRDIFYKTDNLTLQQKKDLLIDAVDLSFKWYIDQLVGWSRQTIKMELDDILNKLTSNSHFVFIQRKGYESWKDAEFFDTSWCLETGFTESGYYLFVFLKNDKLDYFVKKYKLEERII